MPENTSPSKGSVALPEVGTVDGCSVLTGEGAISLIYTTYPTLDAAKSSARALVESRLAACVNILPGMVAIYPWEGRIHEEAEVSVLVKTRSGLRGQCAHAIRAGHPYLNPAVLAFDVSAGSTDYVGWIIENTQAARQS